MTEQVSIGRRSTRLIVIWRAPGAPSALCLLAAAGLALVLLGCGAIFIGANDPPAGAPVVRVEVNEDQISLHPSTARAGEVWLEFPDGGVDFDLVTSGFERLQPLKLSPTPDA